MATRSLIPTLKSTELSACTSLPYFLLTLSNSTTLAVEAECSIDGSLICDVSLTASVRPTAKTLAFSDNAALGILDRASPPLGSLGAIINLRKLDWLKTVLEFSIAYSGFNSEERLRSTFHFIRSAWL